MLNSVRIIAGSFRSRTLSAPPGLATRPSSDRLRETLFNVLAPRIEGAAFLDLYAGSGAVGIEALSRGAARVEFVEREPRALKVLRGNLERLGLRAGFHIHAVAVGAFLRRACKVISVDREVHATAGRGAGATAPCLRGSETPDGNSEAPKRERYEVVFLDPPWDAAAEYASTLGLLGGAAIGLLAPGALVIAEHRRKQSLEERYGSLERTRLLEQGDAALSFYAGCA